MAGLLPLLALFSSLFLRLPFNQVSFRNREYPAHGVVESLKLRFAWNLGRFGQGFHGVIIRPAWEASGV
jgi:hypothetical protein